MEILNVGESYCLRLFKLQTSTSNLLNILEAEHQLVKKVRLKKGITEVTNKLKIQLRKNTELTEDEINFAIKSLREDLKNGNVIYSKNDDGVQVKYKSKSPYPDIVMGKHCQVYAREDAEFAVDVPGHTRPIPINNNSKKKNKEEADINENDETVYILDKEIKNNIEKEEHDEMGKNKSKKVKNNVEKVDGVEKVDEINVDEIVVNINEIDDEISEFVSNEMEKIKSETDLDDISEMMAVFAINKKLIFLDNYTEMKNKALDEYDEDILIKAKAFINGVEEFTKRLISQEIMIGNCGFDIDDIKSCYNLSYSKLIKIDFEYNDEIIKNNFIKVSLLLAINDIAMDIVKSYMELITKNEYIVDVLEVDDVTLTFIKHMIDTHLVETMIDDSKNVETKKVESNKVNVKKVESNKVEVKKVSNNKNKKVEKPVTDTVRNVLNSVISCSLWS